MNPNKLIFHILEPQPNCDLSQICNIFQQRKPVHKSTLQMCIMHTLQIQRLKEDKCTVLQAYRCSASCNLSMHSTGLPYNTVLIKFGTAEDLTSGWLNMQFAIMETQSHQQIFSKCNTNKDYDGGKEPGSCSAEELLTDFLDSALESEVRREILKEQEVLSRMTRPKFC